jgi:hypothetical protein
MMTIMVVEILEAFEDLKEVTWGIQARADDQDMAVAAQIGPMIMIPEVGEAAA